MRGRLRGGCITIMRASQSDAAGRLIMCANISAPEYLIAIRAGMWSSSTDHIHSQEAWDVVVDAAVVVVVIVDTGQGRQAAEKFPPQRICSYENKECRDTQYDGERAGLVERVWWC
jgi:hypothetical protein